MPSDRRRLLDKLIRALVRSETHAIEGAQREARHLGDTPPVTALHDVSVHAVDMRARFALALEGHDLEIARGGIGTTLAALRHLVSDYMYDPERSFRGALLDLHQGIDLVRVLRDIARLEELFSLIRWCDDWLTARRALVARADAQLDWYTTQPAMPSEQVTARDEALPPIHELQ